MYLTISLNPRHERDRVHAFFESLKIHEHQIALVYGESDLIDPKEPPSLENLGVSKYFQNGVEAVIYETGAGSKLVRLELYRRVNTVEPK